MTVATYYPPTITQGESAGWSNLANATGYPDGTFASANLGALSDYTETWSIFGGSFSLSDLGTITQVRIGFKGYAEITNQYWWLLPCFNGTNGTASSLGTLTNSNTSYWFDVTSQKSSWSWSDFSTLLIKACLAPSSAKTNLYLDSFALEVTYTEQQQGTSEIYQSHTRWYDDDDAPATATALAAEGTSINTNAGTNLQLRIGTINAGDGTQYSYSPLLEYSEDSGTWTTVPAGEASPVFVSPSDYFANRTAIGTARLSTGNYPFTNGVACDIENPALGGSDTIYAGYCTETVWCVAFTEDAAGHTYRFRMTNGGSEFGGYEEYATVEIFGTATAAINATFPAMSAASLAEAIGEASIFGTLPAMAAALNADGTADVALNATLSPMASQLVSECSASAAIDATFPVITTVLLAEIACAGAIDADFPAISGQLTAEVWPVVEGMIDATFPPMSARIRGETYSVAEAFIDADFPPISGALQGEAAVSVVIDGTFPAMIGQLEADAYQIAIARIDATFPSAIGKLFAASVVSTGSFFFFE